MANRCREYAAACTTWVTSAWSHSSWSSFIQKNCQSEENGTKISLLKHGTQMRQLAGLIQRFQPFIFWEQVRIDLDPASAGWVCNSGWIAAIALGIKSCQHIDASGQLNATWPVKTDCMKESWRATYPAGVTKGRSADSHFSTAF